MEKGLIAIAAALSVMTGMVTGIGEARVAQQAVESIGKNPDAADQIRSMAIIGAAISETCAIYGLLIAFLIIFVLGA
ncbi:MAG: F0F1 ATP synthase subunit C [Erysipelotrichaceae bacterium]|nr:F0F1 ATP synthase subunit C [Erysipelotrichaceae bacterium]MBQ4252853.1 F0F1 ATP synthase subunit C [Erysipelotrichaceae bacterium]MBQ7223406.1 F0F1 ATP synthase subunit C [Erysipelotrichaceae bacterium]